MKKQKYTSYLPLIIVIIANLLIGFFIVGDFGESWDEQSLREYTEITLNAYSRPFVDLEQSGFFAESILRYYGPAYLLLASGLMKFLQILSSGISVIDQWHFANFVSYQIGIIFFYLLCRRFLRPVSANAVLILFSTQPLFWGHAFINPKDIPFMSFFLATLVSGMWMTDRFPRDVGKVKKNRFALTLDNIADDWHQAKISSKRSFVCITILWGMLIVFRLLHERLKSVVLQPLIEHFYYARPGSIAAQIFSWFAGNAASSSVEDYMQKSGILLTRFEMIAIILLMLLFLICLFSIQKTGVAWLFGQYLVPFLKKMAGALRKPETYLAGCFLGICVSIRAIGPAAGLLVVMYMGIELRWKSLPLLLDYVLIAFLVMLAAWPYLWGDAIHRYFESMQVMSQFPFGADVLFNGHYFRPDELPASYLPVLMLRQFTEPLVVLFFLGMIFSIVLFIREREKRKYLLVFYAWFFFPLFAIMLFRPPLYDNFRQFFFITPPVFLIAAIALERLFERVRHRAMQVLVIVLLAVPGVVADIHLHPYPYVYYNQFSGGVNAAFRQFELDYWATSYKEAAAYVNEVAPKGARIIASEPIHILENYARDDLIIDLFPEGDENLTGQYDYAITTTRFEKDTYIFPSAPIVFQVSRDGAEFAVVKKIH